MKDISVPFSLFDFFAVLMPGAVGLGAVYLFLNPSLSEAGNAAVFSRLAFLQFDSELLAFTLLVLASYLLGQVLNALAELLVDRTANRLLGAHIVDDLGHRTVQQAIRKHLGAGFVRLSARRLLATLEALVGTHMPEVAASARTFIALAVMFQTLALTLFLVLVALLRAYWLGALFAGSLASLAMAVGLLLLLIGVLFWSYRRYKGMWSRTVMMGFVAWVNSGGARK
jgi:hypothetical protein